MLIYYVIVPGCFRSPRPLWFSLLSWRRHRAVCSTSKADRNGRTGQCWGANNMKLWSYQVSTELIRRKLFPIKYCLVSCWVQTRTNVSEQLNWAHRLKSILSNSSDQKAQAQQGSILCVYIYIYLLYCSSTKNCLGKSRLMGGCHVEITVQDKKSMFASRHNGWEEDPASDGQQTGLGNSDSLWPNMGKQQLPERGKYNGKMSETPKALES